MRSPSPLRSTARRFIAALMAFTMVFAQVETAHAALTALADIPIAAKVAAKPNIVYTLDDSGSMKLNYLPDYITATTSFIPLTNITRSVAAPGTTATATLSAANNALLSVGDYITINGVLPPEYNGFFVIVSKPTGTTFTYTLASVPVGTTTSINVAGGYTQRQVAVSTAYCRGNTFAAGCAQQAFNITPTTTYPITTITRPAASMLATATVSAANNLLLTTGDYITIQGATQPEYNGFFQITKINATQFQYTMLAVPAVSPAGGGSKQFVLTGGTWAAPPLHASDMNRLAYNPAVTYMPPVVYNMANPNGTPMTSPGTDAQGNYGSTATLYGTATVERDPFANFETAAGETPMWPYTTKDNLSLRVNVQVYCNTDWPILVNDPNGGLNVLDVGNVNGQYSASAGGYCRINGTQYAAHGTSLAPAVQADYNYPWQKTLAADAENPQYFYKQLNNKSLYCDLTSPNRPRTGVITSCGVGGTPTYAGPPVQQRCVRGGNICNPVVANRNYLPNGPAPTLICKTDPANLFCAPNVGGSDGNSPGTGALPECTACTCVADTLNPNGNCNSTGAACNSAFGVWGGNLAQCPDVPNTITGCSVGTPVYQLDSLACGKLIWDPATNAPEVPNVTLLADSNNANGGRVCRHNNMTYTVGGAAGLYKYSTSAPAFPGEGTGTGLFNQNVTSGCPAVGTVVAIPRHYYMLQPIAATTSNVQFCDDYIQTPSNQWRGFGTGVCQDKNDLARFKNVKYGQFVRVDLWPGNTLNYAGTSKPFPPNGDGIARDWLAASPAIPGPDNSESINYANWYAYYSTRLSAGKTTSSIAFSYLTTVPPEPINYRVGFHNFGDESPPNGADATGLSIKLVNVADWNDVQRTAWYAQLFGIAVAFNRTPTMNAMLRVGGLFETGTNVPPDPTVNPLPATATDPIDVIAGNQVSCQNNYHILFTDGVTNQNALPTTAGDADATVPNFMQTVTEVPPEKVLTNFRPPIVAMGGAWPRPFVQGTPVANTLSDIGAYYWGRDLRPSLTNDVPSQSGAANGDLDWTKDVAWWQHVNFNAISFGAEGTLDATRQSATMAAIKGPPATQNWPNLTTPNNPIYPKGAAKGAVAVDDLWHATVMARGSFVYARTPTEVAYGLASILSGIQNQRKSRAAAAFSGQVLDATTNVVFIPTIEPGWAGDLIKWEINPVTAALNPPAFWSASATLAAQIDPVATGVAEPWMDEAYRRVVTIAGAFGSGTATGGVAFRHGNLHSDQKLSLAPAPGGNTLKQEKLVSYLRGGNTYTPISGTPVYQIEGTGIGQFRKRYGALGDISNAEPVIVNPPDRPYVDTTDPGYSTFKSNSSGRPSVVVAPANDGMVHVFDAGPMPHAGANPGDPPVPASAGGGTELFAYIPKALFRGVAGAVAIEDVTAIQALAYQDGGVPIYHHHMYVDSSPREADIDTSNGAGTGWKSIVVGGLGKGGNSYYALDVTDLTDLTSSPTEAKAAAKVMWEWSNSELKYSFGRPVIVKVRDSAYPTGRWVVIVTAGYNNATGVGKIYFLDAATGVPIGPGVSTSVGSAGSPSGLAQIHAFVKNQANQVAEQIYGGDLEGNFWRIDVSGVDQYKSATAELFAILHDGTNRQPVTTAPQIEIDVNNGVDRYVFIGTGQLLHQLDLTVPTPTRQQTFYAIRDGTLQSMKTTGLPIDVRSGILKSVNTDTPDMIQGIIGGAPDGWLHDLPNIVGDAERIVVDVQANVNVAQYIGTKVQDDPCVISLPAVLYARDYTTARSLIQDTSDPTGNTQVASYDLPSGAVGNLTVGIRLPDGSFALSALISQEIPGTTPVKLQNPVTGPGNRLSWRLLGVE